MSHTHHDEGRFSFEPGVDVAAVIFQYLKDTETRAALSCVSRTWREAKQRDRARYSTRTTWMEEWPFEYPFRIFITDVRPNIIAENHKFYNFRALIRKLTDKELGEVCRELDAQWAKLSDSEKRLQGTSIVRVGTVRRTVWRIRSVPLMKHEEKRWLRECGWT
jgi:hypothetical protein